MFTPLEKLKEIVQSNIKNKTYFYFEKAIFYYWKFLTGFKKIVLKLIKLYQKTLSPDQGFLNPLKERRICRFYPSCSGYSYQAIEKYGLLGGLFLSVKRILKCHPWNPGGVDQP